MQKRFYSSAAVILVLAMFSVNINAQVLILKSAGSHAQAEYRAGTVIDENSAIDLKKGDHIVLLYGQATRTFHGPAIITPVEAFTNNVKSGKLAALADFLTSSSEKRTELGAVRGSDKTPADPWVVDVTKPGIKCVISVLPLILWRGMDVPGDQGSISLNSGRTAFLFSWPPGETEADWPAEIEWTPGQSLAIDYGLGETIKFQIRVMPQEIVDSGARLVWLAEQGCNDQVSALLDRI